MTRDRIEKVIHTLWQECETQMGVDKRQTLHNTVVRCAFSQAVFDRYSGTYGDGIYRFIAKVIGRARPTIFKYVGPEDYPNVKTAHHTATLELADKLAQRLIKLENMRQVNVRLSDGRWYVNDKQISNELIEKLIREYETINA